MYDGDGRRLKDATINPVNYELRSSVLGGQIVNYLFANGEHGGGVVYADGIPVGKAPWDLNGPLHWELHSPINSGVIDMMLGLIVQRDKEFSPIGDGVGVENPYISGGEGGGGYPAGGGDPSAMRCAFDGLEADCNSVFKFAVRRNFYFLITSIIKKRFAGTVTSNRAVLVSGGSHGGNVVYGTAGPGGKPSSVDIIGEPDRFEIHPGTDIAQTINLTYTTTSLVLPQNPIPNVGGTKDKGAIKDFTNAFNEAVSRLDDPDCAILFGGKTAALSALYGASYSYRNLGRPSYNSATQSIRVTGAATNSNTNPPSVYINTNGPFRNTTLFVSTPTGVQSRTLDFRTGLRGEQFGALLLLHELGHLTKVFRADAGNDQLNLSYTQQVQKACFK